MQSIPLQPVPHVSGGCRVWGGDDVMADSNNPLPADETPAWIGTAPRSKARRGLGAGYERTKLKRQRIQPLLAAGVHRNDHWW